MAWEKDISMGVRDPAAVLPAHGNAEAKGRNVILKHYA